MWDVEVDAWISDCIREGLVTLPSYSKIKEDVQVAINLKTSKMSS
jgi:hypothetical protein